MKKLLALCFLVSTSLHANMHLAPPDFNYFETRAIFVDFKSATYDITYDAIRKTATVKSRIEFTATQMGRPIFDLVPDPTSVKIDGERVGSEVILTPNNTPTRILSHVIEAGDHVLEVENNIKKNVKFGFLRKSISSAFWFKDLTERKFMEQYVPSNFEFDQYQMVLNVAFMGIGNKKQDIFANGEVKEIAANKYRITYPAYFTASSPYFHTTPQGKFRRYDFSYQSISGKEIPMTVYAPFYLLPAKFKTKALEVMAELENDYGPWAHSSFIAYGTLPWTGGMEHSGATQTSLPALDHEMLHSYFAKGVMPANGNSGWIDEAIASWRDHGYPSLPLPSFSGSTLGKHSVYQRETDARAYSLGMEFMAYLDYRLQPVGGLKAFLKGYFAAYKHTLITTEHFKNNLEFFSGLDLSEDFKTYIWGEDPVETQGRRLTNPHHPQLTEKQIESLI